MAVKTDSIAFPQEAHGRDAIASLLVSGFAQQYENVYTFCVGATPDDWQREFSCDWLVCMTERMTGAGRVGYGRYDWIGDADAPLATRLKITIEEMAAVPKEFAHRILQWANRLPYPWCPREALTHDAPDIDAIQRAITQLTR